MNESNEESLVKVYERLSTVGAVAARRARCRRRWSCTRSTTCRSSPSPSGARAAAATPCGRSPRSWPRSSPRSRTRARRSLIGGQPRAVRVEPDPDRMNAAGVSWTALTAPCSRRPRARTPGPWCADNRELRVEAGPSSGAPQTWARVVVGVRAGRPGLRARRGPRARRARRGPGRRLLLPGPAQAATAAPRARVPGGDHRPRQAAGRECHRPRRAGARQGRGPASPLLPADVHVEVTRNYGETARREVERARASTC